MTNWGIDRVASTCLRTQSRLTFTQANTHTYTFTYTHTCMDIHVHEHVNGHTNANICLAEGSVPSYGECWIACIIAQQGRFRREKFYSGILRSMVSITLTAVCLQNTARPDGATTHFLVTRGFELFLPRGQLYLGSLPRSSSPSCDGLDCITLL